MIREHIHVHSEGAYTHSSVHNERVRSNARMHDRRARIEVTFACMIRMPIHGHV
jgi:hypothetical protein